MSQIVSDSAVQGFPGKRVERVIIEAFQGEQLPDGTIKSRGMVQRAMFNIETEVSIVSLEHQMETIRTAGHLYVRWVTAQDEKVCGFCASRHGKVYLSAQIRIPAHTRCRCMAVPVKPEDIAIDDQFWKEEQDATIAAYAKAHNLTPEEAARKLQEYGRKPTQFEKYAQPVDPKPVQAVWEPGQLPAPPPPTPSRTFRDELQERAAPLMQDLEKFRLADQKRLDRLDKLTTLTGEAQVKAFAENASKADVDAYLKLVEQKGKLITQLANSKDDAFQKLRKRMLETPLSDYDIQAVNKGLKISYGDPGPIGTVPTATVTKGTAKDLQRDAKAVMGQRDEFVRMFNGRGATGFRADTAAPSAIYITDDRARAGIWSGEVWLPRDNKRVTFHELAHFQEKQHPDLAIELDKWKKSKADSVIDGTIKPIRMDGDLPVYRLRDLTGDPAYDDTEIAYKDDYLNKYMGKVYPATTGPYSEVWSMAVEHFADSASMRKLWAKHPDLFELVVGMSQMPP
jgi:hypothetical protein